MSKKVTNEQLAQEIKCMGAEERRKILDKQNKILSDKIREKIRRKQEEEDIQTIIDDVFADLPDEAPTGTLTMFSADDILGTAQPRQLGTLRQFINSHKKD